MRHMKIIILALTVVAITSVIAGCCITSSTSSPDPSSKPTATDSPSKPIMSDFGYSMSGTGSYTSDAIELNSGLAILEYEAKGTRTFSIQLLNDRGEWLTESFNAWNSSSGTTAFHIDTKGVYKIEVFSGGNDHVWLLKIKQPVYSNGDKVPLDLSGKGNVVTQPFYLNSGKAKFRMNYNGDFTYCFVLIDANGESIDYLAYGNDTYIGDAESDIKNSGVYLLKIETAGMKTDGLWEVKVSQ